MTDHKTLYLCYRTILQPGWQEEWAPIARVAVALSVGGSILYFFAGVKIVEMVVQ